ncbi:hypothetical protein BGZ76_009025 [Entomortierella beljakovae]|nr:hypothetical protein BGZ76_009025 [Entomortierella beljakovae]
MQALTPLLFSMLFPRYNNPSPERRNSGLDESEYSQDTLVNSPTSIDRRYSFGDGYLLEREEQIISTKARRHRSAGSTRRSATDPTNDHFNTATATTSGSSSINRNGASHHSRKANPPKSLSIDHAAFMATYPMLDGLGDTVRTSDSEYYGPLINTASPKPKTRKQRSQDAKETAEVCFVVVVKLYFYI